MRLRVALRLHPEAADPERRVGRGLLAGRLLAGRLEKMDAGGLLNAFGPELEPVGWKYATEAGCGERSLAVLRAKRRPVLSVDDRFGRLQIRFNDLDRPVYLPVTDVRFYEEDQATIRKDIVEDVSGRIRKGVEVFLMLRLAHAYRAPSDDRERHWLQANGLCLADNPVADTP